MTLYGYWRSTASWRVRLALALKGLPFETVPVHLAKGEQAMAQYRAINPQTFLPALKLDDGTVLTQSIAVLEWLEETRPEPAFLPADPIARARVRAFVNIIAADTHPVQNLRILKRLKSIGQDQEQINAWAAWAISTGLEACDAMIAGQPGPYCFGDQLTMADLVLVPQLFNARRYGVDLCWPRILEIEAACNELPAFKAAAPEAQPDYVP